MPRQLTRFDELNTVRQEYETMLLSTPVEDIDEDEVIDSVLDLLIMAYMFGYDSANNDLDTDLKPQEEQFNGSVYKQTKGKNFEERIRDYIAEAKEGRMQGEDLQVGANPLQPIIPVIETETHRVINEAEMAAAQHGGAKYKAWTTMMDDRVRDTHSYLHGMNIPVEEEFYTYDGDHAMCPGGFTQAENNVNCRCHLRFSK